jgi:hypothetical protein
MFWERFWPKRSVPDKQTDDKKMTPFDYTAWTVTGKPVAALIIEISEGANGAVKAHLTILNTLLEIGDAHVEEKIDPKYGLTIYIETTWFREKWDWGGPAKLRFRNGHS